MSPKVASATAIATLIVTIACIGCEQGKLAAPGQAGAARCVVEARGKPIDAACAIELAKAEIVRQQGAQIYRRFTANHDATDGTWVVMAIYEPEKPGGHVFVLLSDDGRVLDYTLGR